MFANPEHERIAAVQDSPLGILQVATAIGESRGTLPAAEVTELATSGVPLLADLEPAVVRDALTECLKTRDVDVALQWLYDIGFIHWFLPELAATKDLAQEGGRRHKDVWEHTKLVVRQAVKRPAVRWGALLHDIGKVPTRRFTSKGVHFHGHAEVGARMFDKMCRRVPFERPMRQTIRFLIKHHLRAAQYEPSWTDSAVRRFDREMAEHLTDLLDLSRADITSKRPGRRQALLRQISTLSDRIEALREKDAVKPPLRKGIGSTIMSHFDLPPSKLIGDLKKAVEGEVEAGNLEPYREDEYYIEWLEKSGLVPR